MTNAYYKVYQWDIVECDVETSIFSSKINFESHTMLWEEQY